MYYVRIKRINGRYAFYELIRELESKGYGDRVEYFEGDGFVASHLRFLDEDDAVAYSITHGLFYTENIPMLKD